MPLSRRRPGLLLHAVFTAIACGSPPSEKGPATVVVPASSAEPSDEPLPRSTAAPVASPGSKSPEALAQAEASFAEGRRLMNAGKWAEACEHFAASLELDRAIGTLLNLANCEERTGDTRAACKHYAEARDIAQQKGSDAREQLAVQRLGALGCP